jgi:hypothetical protein
MIFLIDFFKVRRKLAGQSLPLAPQLSRNGCISLLVGAAVEPSPSASLEGTAANLLCNCSSLARSGTQPKKLHLS